MYDINKLLALANVDISTVPTGRLLAFSDRYEVPYVAKVMHVRMIKYTFSYD